MQSRRFLALVLFGALLSGCNRFGLTSSDSAPNKEYRPTISTTMPSNIQPNTPTSFNSEQDTPLIQGNAYIHPQAAVIGEVHIGEHTFVGPFASVRGDEGTPIWIGDNSNIQDGVVIHALETEQDGKLIPQNIVTMDGKNFAVYIGSKVSLAHQSQIHGPALVEDNVFVGMQALVFKATVGKDSVIEPGAKVIGVVVPPGRYVSAGTTVTLQTEADKLPAITKSYAYYDLNNKVLHVNEELAKGYRNSTLTEKN